MHIERKLELRITNPSTLASFRWALKLLRKKRGYKTSYDSWDALEVISSVDNVTTKNVLYQLLRKLYQIAEWDWNDNIVKRPPKIDFENVKTPVLDKDLIIQTINNANTLSPLLKTIWALSTTWGMRRNEILMILENPDWVMTDEDPPRLKIKAQKGGITRLSLIPEEIFDVIELIKKHDMSISKSRISALFHHIIYRTTGKLMPEKGFGYHSVRRALINYLLPPYTTLSDAEVFRFMRWSDTAAGRVSILYRYASTAKEESWFDLDRKVYSQHPWLKYWGGK